MISESGRSLGEENGNPLQYSCLGNFKDRGACQEAVYGVAKSWTQLNNDKDHNITVVKINVCSVASVVSDSLQLRGL